MNNRMQQAKACLRDNCELRESGMKTTSIMIVGVGGQGSLLASRLLGTVLTDEGYDVKLSEVHGMSQRGGSVVTYVRYGDKVYSPIVTEGECDYIISFEKLEAARYAGCLRKGGKIIVNTQQIDPMPVITGAAAYPEDVLDQLKAKGILSWKSRWTEACRCSRRMISPKRCTTILSRHSRPSNTS